MSIQRQCGGCTLCCRLVPVKNLDKPANQRCVYQRTGKGCAVYDKLFKVSPSCVLWSCRWLVNNDAADLSRPDRSHYVIDIMPDFITITENNKEPVNIEVVQVWCDPNHRDAYKDPALLAYLARRGEDGIAAIIRYAEHDGFVILPPAMTPNGKFYEHRHGTIKPERSTEERIVGLATAARKVKFGEA
jgi:hypothetical protein